jgi:uncharacterized tellurite resistance protein B-like protein
MFDRLKTLLTSIEITDQPTDDPTPLAAAMLLFEVAWADHEIMTAEIESMVSALTQLFGVEESAARALTDRAIETHETETSIYPFTRSINEALSIEEKQQLITTLWRLALADQIVDKYEEHAIRRIADLLYVPHRDFIRAKRDAQA